MSFISNILPYIQVGLSVIMIACILLQTSAAGLGGAFGGGDSFDSSYHTRRGFEKFLFNLTIIVAILFAVSALLVFVK
ncbi:preprotein translocase subunit SecG [Candidatus Nomurabacteria bacterium]|nr:preprotein translocase subunit SecG [Candidatus Nomurabacteria bacterium]